MDVCVWMLRGCGVTVDGGVSMCACAHIHACFSVVQGVGVYMLLWVWHLITAERCSPQRSTAHVIPAEMKCSPSFFLRTFSL